MSAFELEDDEWARWLAADVLNDTANATECGSTTNKDLRYRIAINLLVFITVSGISSVVEYKEFRDSFRKPPIYAGASFQFLLMPFIGFVCTLIFPLKPLQAVTLLVMTASPGGSYSNWWCNLFNADLALSVSMTSLSTVCSVFMLPLNILIYITFAYERTHTFDGNDVNVDFKDLGLTLGLVIGAILTGLTLGTRYPKLQPKMNTIGNVAGMASIILGVFASADTCDGKPPWRQPFYPLWVATAFPLLVSLTGVFILSTLLGLKKPQRVAIALETAYQNTSIALAYTVGQGDAGREAAGIPVIYGGYEAGFFLIFMVTSWKMGWTFAPPNEKLWKVMFETWQPGSPNYRRLHPEEYEAKEVPVAKEDEEKKLIVEAKEADAETGADTSDEGKGSDQHVKPSL